MIPGIRGLEAGTGTHRGCTRAHGETWTDTAAAMLSVLVPAPTEMLRRDHAYSFRLRLASVLKPCG
jgi:hypothetical protein